MRNFLKSTILFLLPVLILGIMDEFLLRHIPNDYELKSSYLKKHTNEIAILFLGSSHAFYGVNPAIIKENSFNAAYYSQSLDLDDKILEKYSNSWKNLKFIVIPISYFSLYSTLKDDEESWRLKNYDMYYGIETTGKLSNHFEIFSKCEQNMYKLYLYYFQKHSLLTSSHLGWGIYRTETSKTDFPSSGAKAAKRHTAINKKYFVSNKSVLEHIIKFADQRNIQVLFYTPPAYKTYQRNLNAKQLNQTTTLMENLAAHRRNVTYINLLKDNSFQMEDFHDADHLNKFGAKKLTVMLDLAIHHIKRHPKKSVLISD